MNWDWNPIKEDKRLMKPELLCPAGDMTRLRAAIMYGADSVYLAGHEFGLRTAPANFGFDELADAVNFAHERGVRVHIACNTIPHCGEMERLPAFLERVNDIGADALIVADLGTFTLAQQYAPDVAIHASVQAGVTNHITARRLYDMGASRVILARELTLEEIAEIRAKTPARLEIECFVHGAICLSYSGRCLISDYLTSRDANRGDCAQPCRWSYALMEKSREGQYFPIFEDEGGSYILNSKDLNLIEHIPELIRAGVSCFKIEGRAKSDYYVAVTANAYRCAIDSYCDGSREPEDWVTDELNKISHREYSTGFFCGRPKGGQCDKNGGYIREYNLVGVVKGYDNGRVTLEQRNRFFEGDTLEVLQPRKKPFLLTAANMRDADNNPITSAPHAAMTLSMDCDIPVEKGAYLRQRIQHTSD